MSDPRTAGAVRKMYPGSYGSRVATPATRSKPTRKQPGSCPTYLGQLQYPSSVNNGGTGLVNGGTVLVTSTFEVPVSSGYLIRWWSIPDLALLAAYDATDLYTQGAPDVIDFTEYDDDGNLYAWDTASGALQRWVISGGAYVFDATLRTGETGEHQTVFNHVDGFLYSQWLHAGAVMRKIDPATGTATATTTSAVTPHYRMAVTADGAVWRALDGSTIARWVSDTEETFAFADNEMFGFFPWSQNGLAVMNADSSYDLNDVTFPIKVAYPGGSIIDAACRWTPKTIDPAGSTPGHGFGVLHGAAGLFNTDRMVLRAGLNLGGGAEFNRNTDEGIWTRR